jgi:hydrogenase/urease accessory protein HupE
MRSACLLALALAGLAGPAAAHRLSPAYFGLDQTSESAYDAQWKVSISGGLADTLEPQIPAGCAVDGNVRNYTVADARVVHARLNCDGPLAGREFVVEGLPATDTDVLLRVDYLDGSSFTHRLVPESPTVVFPEQPGTLEVVATYLELGVEHILLGVDHLLFVLALLLLVNGWKRLVATVTAFTIAHSITLGAAALGFVTVPSVPVEATIALSILFVATELARGHSDTAAARSANPHAADTLTHRFPWLVAFTFGLLHGFGFAGALNEVGLPQQAIPVALLFFNVGVELGQLVFIAAVLGLGEILRRLALAPPAWAPRATAYVIGCVSAFWVFERTLLAV